MNKDILVIAPTHIPDICGFVDSISERYEDASIIIYALGNKEKRFQSQLQEIDYSRCIFDIDIDDDFGSVNIDYLREFEEDISPQHILNDVIYTDRNYQKMDRWEYLTIASILKRMRIC